MKLLNLPLQILSVAILLSLCNSSFSYQSCINYPKLQQAASNLLSKLEASDQREREKPNLTKNDWLTMNKNDLKRRIQVSELFAEGCFKSAADYYNAAMIFQHGDAPDQYYQAFIWAKRSAELGNFAGKHMSFLAVDRYLVSVGKKQLFGSQYYAKKINTCFCMQPVEKSFSDKLRKEYAGATLKEHYDLMASINQKNCPQIECDIKLSSLSDDAIASWAALVRFRDK